MKVVVVAIVAIVLMGAAGYIGFTSGMDNDKLQVENAPVFQRTGGGGTGFQSGQGGSNNLQQAQGAGQGTGTGTRGAVTGTIKSVNGNTLHVTLQNGSTITVTVDSRTTIQKAATAALADIQPGVPITVTLDTTGGTPTARTVQIGTSGR